MFSREDIIAVILVVLTIYLLLPLADALVLGIVTAYGLRVLVEKMEDVISRRIAEVVLMTGLFVIVTGGAYLVTTNVSTISMEVFRLSRVASESIRHLMEPYSIPLLSDLVTDTLDAASLIVATKMSQWVTKLPWLLLELLTYFLIVFYLYRDGDRFVRAFDELVRRLPEAERRSVFQARKSVEKLVGDLFTVYGLLAVIMGVLGASGFYLIGMVFQGQPIPFFWAWGILIGLSAFMEGMASILFTGPLMGYYFFVSGDLGMGFALLAFQVVVLTLLPEMVLVPYLGAKKLKESYWIIILGFVTGPFVLGIKGVVLGPVFIITLKNLLKERLSTMA
jgi:predicted PurR-regulated permease PerM